MAQPDAAAWDRQVQQALTDAASEVATARLALETARRERVWASYTTVVVAQAEEAVGTLADDLARVEVPRGREKRSEAVSTLLDDAVTAVEGARSLAVQEVYGGDVTEELDQLADELERAAATG